MNKSKVLESKVLIRFPDCDPFNHLNNSRYIDYFINAREDHLWENYQLNIYAYGKEHGKSWVVGQNQIAYLKPAMLMETVVIQSTLLELTNTDILVEMYMWDKTKTQLKAILWSKFVHFNFATQKRDEHSKELMDYFKPLENPLDRKMTFEERVKEIKSKL
ncbi:MAG: acyl-CoA thioesterase [Flavipsychrobacter sp.]